MLGFVGWCVSGVVELGSVGEASLELMSLRLVNRLGVDVAPFGESSRC